jgi:hypothetical protein
MMYSMITHTKLQSDLKPAVITRFIGSYDDVFLSAVGALSLLSSVCAGLQGIC